MEKDIYQKLLAAVEKLPENAVERADKKITRKGYDTTGYQYQFLVNVMNEVLGIDGWTFTYTIVKELSGTWGQNPRPFHEITTNVKVSIGNTTRECAGGHKADSHADALKGAITNGFKKAVALFGVGKKAYEGTIDEDYRAEEDNKEYVKPAKKSDFDLAMEKIETTKWTEKTKKDAIAKIEESTLYDEEEKFLLVDAIKSRL